MPRRSVSVINAAPGGSERVWRCLPAIRATLRPYRLFQTVRVEFFEDDRRHGLFDPDTQRRIENLGAAEILPAAEVLPQLAPGGAEAGCWMGWTVRRLPRAKRRKGSETLVQTLEEDRERLSASTAFPAMDRYIALIYPVMATAADYFPGTRWWCSARAPGWPSGERATCGSWERTPRPRWSGESWPGSWLTSPAPLRS